MSREYFNLDDIYPYDPDALVQFCHARPIDSYCTEWEVEDHIEDVDGAEALRVLRNACETQDEPGCEDLRPMYIDGKIMGYRNAYGPCYIYTDCDEETYVERYGRPYSLDA